ncbi:MAG: hypothetical protein ACJ8DD_13120 [Microvirga sp.]
MSRIRVAAVSVARSTRVAVPLAVSIVPGTTCGSAVSRGTIAAGIAFIPGVPVIPGISLVPAVAIAARIAVSVASAVSFPAALVAFLGGSRRVLQG